MAEDAAEAFVVGKTNVFYLNVVRDFAKKRGFYAFSQYLKRFLK